MNNRKFNSAAQTPLFSTGRQPATAAMLSVIPGLGQFYNGQSVKGFLFMDVAAVNAILLTIVLFAEPMAKGLKTLLTGNHIRANDGVLHALESAHIGTPFSMVLLSMILLFVGFAARDAYDSARTQKLKPIYGDSALQLSEAASGSYLFHFAALFSLAILALCFLVPKPDVPQITEIIFTPPDVKDVEPVKAHKFSSVSSSAKHREVQVKNPTPASSHASASKQNAQQQSHPAQQQSHPAQTRSQSRPTPAKPAESKPATLKAEPAPQPPAPHPVAPAPKQPVAVPHVAPQPIPMPMPVKATAPGAVSANSAPVPSALKTPTTTVTPPPLLAMAPTLPTGFAPAPLALNHTTPSGITGLPSPSEAKRGSNQSHGTASGAPAPQNIQSGKGSDTNPIPAPISGAHGKGTSNTPTGESYSPRKIASAVPGGGTGIVTPVATGPHGGPRGENSSPLRDSRGNDTESGAGKGHENVKIDVDFGPYMADLQRRIKRAWIPPHDPSSRQVVLEFKVFRNGELGSVKVVRSSGLAKNDQAAVSAVRDAAPFSPLPKGADDSVDIQFTFDYHVFGGHAT